MFKLGEVKIPCDQDFDYVKKQCYDDQDWTIDYNKSAIKVWVKKNELSSFNMIKVRADFDDVSASVLYNVLQDGRYRPQWDDRMVEGLEICYLSPCSDIGYYSIKSPKPFKNRDFVTQRCWLDIGDDKEKIIFNHSVNHAKVPLKKNYVRGLSFLTAYVIKPNSPKSCTLNYVSQGDPGGSLPSWLVNTTTKVFAPKFVKKLHKACLKYDKWKSKNDPDFRPWTNPEQIQVPRIDWNDIKSLDLSYLQNNVDESQINENDMDKNEQDENGD